MRGAAPGQVRIGAAPASAGGWLWPVLVLGLCHADAVASAQVLNILVDPIKASLLISDTRYSLLQGFALAIFAALLGVPAARAADRGGRRRILLAGVLGWTLGSIACAFAHSFSQLFAARMLVGIGEVLLFPAALAMISEVTPHDRLARAIAIFGCGGPIGAAVALGGGGWLVAHPHLARGVVEDPWRLAFLACALFGALAFGLLLTVREPVRQGAFVASASSLAAAGDLLRRRWRLFLGVATGLLALSLCVFATTAWAPAFLVRAHGFSYGEAGAVTGMASLVCAVGGTWLAGWSSDRLERAGRRDGVLVVSVAGAALLIVLIAAALLAPTRAGAAVSLAAVYALLGAPTVLGGAALQQMTPPGLRAQVTAVYVLLMNLVSAGMGPAAVALLTDHLFERPSAVGYALALTDATAGLVAIAALVLSRRAFVAQRGEIAG